MKSCLLSSLLSLFLVSMMTCHVQAQLAMIEFWQVGGLGEVLERVTQGSAQHTLAYPPLILWTAIDKEANIWTSTWQGEWYLLTPPSLFFFFSIIFEDDKGFYQCYDKITNRLGPRGTVTIENYTHVGCWARCSAHWIYSFPVPGGIGFVCCDVWVNLYIGA